MKRKFLNILIVAILAIALTRCDKDNESKVKDTSSKVVEKEQIEENTEEEIENNDVSDDSTKEETSNTTTEKKTTNNSSTTDNTNNQAEQKQEETKKCTEKKFSKKYTYAYETLDECKHKGNDAFFYITDNHINDDVFAYDCDQIVDECGTTWYGVRFIQWDENGSKVDYYY